MIYTVVIPNDYFPVGTFLEDNGDGHVQKVRAAHRDGRLHFGGYEGLYIPTEKVRPYLQAILKRGFDDQGAHAELRGAYRRRSVRSVDGMLEDGDSPLSFDGLD